MPRAELRRALEGPCPPQLRGRPPDGPAPRPPGPRLGHARVGELLNLLDPGHTGLVHGDRLETLRPGRGATPGGRGPPSPPCPGGPAPDLGERGEGGEGGERAERGERERQVAARLCVDVDVFVCMLLWCVCVCVFERGHVCVCVCVCVCACTVPDQTRGLHTRIDTILMLIYTCV